MSNLLLFSLRASYCYAFSVWPTDVATIVAARELPHEAPKDFYVALIRRHGPLREIP